MARERTRNHGTTLEHLAPVSAHNLATAAAWERNAATRARQIDSGRDLSRDFAIVPGMLEAIGAHQYNNVLDVGTGDGDFLNRLRDRHAGRRFVGIDVSEKMVELAQSRYRDASTQFFVLEGEQAAEFFGQEAFDLVTANMVFNTAPDLEGVIDSVSQVLTKRGVFVFSLVHPRFFHLMEPLKRHLPSDFDASRETQLMVPFTISLDRRPLPAPILFFHRPLSTYLRLLQKSRFAVVDFIEPLPSPDLETKYLDNWKPGGDGAMLPRFLVVKAEKAFSS